MNFVAKVHQNMTARADRPVLVEARGSELVSFTGAQMLDMVARTRGFVAARGLAPGDRVGLMAPNSATWAAVDQGLLGAGLIVVPLYDRQDPNELASMLRDAGASLTVAATDELAASLRAAEGDVADVVTFADVLGCDPVDDPSPSDLQSSDDCTIIYTSGTSGEPKGVVYTVANVDFMVPQTVSALAATIGERDREDHVFHYLPFCFAGSRLMLWTQLYRGNPLTTSTDLNQLVAEMGAANPNYYLNVPAVLERIRRGVSTKVDEAGGMGAFLYRRALAAVEAQKAGTAGFMDGLFASLGQKVVFPKIRDRIGSRLEFLVCGSAPLTPETQAWFEALGIPVLQVYGLTETTGIVTMDRKDLATPGTVGVPIEGVQVKIGDGGELLVKGDNVFDRYWNKPEATESAKTGDWFHTGDQCEIDDKGRLKIIGRIKNLVIPESGHNVAPEPIESKLMALDESIEHAVVVGHGRPYLSVIVTGTTPEALEPAIEAVNADLPFYKRLRQYHISPEALTIESGLLTANQKLRRTVIEAHFADAIDAMYAGDT